MNARHVLLPLLLATAASQAIAPVEAYGALQVVNKKLSDESGKPVTLRGMSLFESKHPNGAKYFTPGVVKWLATDWNVTLVRAAMGVTSSQWSDGSGSGGTNKGYVEDPAGNQARVEKVVQAAIDAGIYVLVDWHCTGPDYENTDKAKVFFGEMAKKYGNTPNIIWEIWNEPLKGAGEIVSHANAVIPVIRKYSKNPIVVGSPQYSSEPQQFASNPFTDNTNILIALHFYAGSDKHDGYKNNLSASNNAVMVTEWGTCTYTGDGAINTGNSATWMSFLDQNGVSSANWSLNDKNETCSALLPGAANTGGWDVNTELTASGKWVRNYFLTNNKYNGARFTLPDTTTKLIQALKADGASVHENGTDTVLITAAYNKTLPSWTLTLTGQTSGAVYTATGNVSSSVSVPFAATMKKAFTSKTFKAGEKVTATLTPAGKVAASATTTIDILAPVSAEKVRREVAMDWSAGRISLPSYSFTAGQSVTVRLKGFDGRTLWSAASSVQEGPTGLQLQIVRPVIHSLAVLEIEGGTTLVRSKLTPRF
ncbi:MAG: cellulase family glycosylhydrolase [Fibrobacteria bacterium]|nr:cellulase family glycosylhydrolase [Fibrobacteria bacterium]